MDINPGLDGSTSSLLRLLVLGLSITVVLSCRPSQEPKAKSAAVACAQGFPRECYKAGLAELDGLGDRESGALAVFYLEKGCQGGDMLSCWTLGDLYDRGGVVPQDRLRAETYYRTVCDHGGDVACKQLLDILSPADTNAGQSRRDAILKHLCDRGDAPACDALARKQRHMR